MLTPSFQPNGAPVPKPFLPYAEPQIPNYRPTGLPPGMSPLPKAPVNPNSIPTTRPALPDNPAPNPFPPPGKGVRGDNLRRPVPLSKPVNSPTPRVPNTGPLLPTVPFLIRKVIEYVFDPQPTSDGTLPDYDEPQTDPDTQNETQDQTDVSPLNCIPQVAGGQYPSQAWKLIQVEMEEYGNQNGGSSAPIQPAPVVYIKLGRAKMVVNVGTYVTPLGRPPRVTVIGKKTEYTDQGLKLTQYKYAFQIKDYHPITGKYWEGQIGIYESVWILPSQHTGPLNAQGRIHDGQFVKFYTKLTYGNIVVKDFCPGDGPEEPENPNDYDRNQDEENMPCKWKPSNDTNVEGLQLEYYEFKVFRDCSGGEGEDEPYYGNDSANLPVCVGETMKKMLNKIALLEGQQCSKSSKFWDIKPGNQTTLYAGIPPLPSLEIALPVGCVNVGITFDAGMAKADSALRNLKRIGSSNGNSDTFINVMRVWLIDASGNAIKTEELWVPSTLIHIPFQYRSQVCKIRMMPKSIAVTFTVFDTADRWESKLMPT